MRYEAHVANLRKLNVACNHIYLQLKSCLAKRQNTPAEALLKTFVLLIGAWAEVRLLKMLHEPNAFTNAERERILAGRSKVDQWKLAVEVGFRRRYNIPAANLRALPRTAYHRFKDILDLIDNDLRPIIEIRNRLAHGQWARAFNNDLDDFSQDMMNLLHTENALSAHFKTRIIEILSKIVNDLLIGGNAFDRDFDYHYALLEQTKNNLQKREYPVWVGNLRDKYERGSLLRNPQPEVA